jgi:hypothetical protein
MYNDVGIIPISIPITQNRTIQINIVNDDDIPLNLSDRLVIILDSDISLRQSIEINIIGSPSSTQNKKMDIYMISTILDINSEILILGNIDLPVFLNESISSPNSAYLWDDFRFDIDLNRDMLYKSNGRIEIPLLGGANLITNSITIGDVLYLNNFFIISLSTVYNYSGQYKVELVSDDGYITIDASTNQNLVNTYTEDTTIHTSDNTILANIPYFSLNKGRKITITRISDSPILTERYLVEILNKNQI